MDNKKLAIKLIKDYHDLFLLEANMIASTLIENNKLVSNSDLIAFIMVLDKRLKTKTDEIIEGIKNS
jgi:hypothetical protein